MDGLVAPRRLGPVVALRGGQLREPEREDLYAGAVPMGCPERGQAVNRPGARRAAVGSTAEGRTRQCVDQVQETILALDR
jgi:hypothetical protein